MLSDLSATVSAMFQKDFSLFVITMSKRAAHPALYSKISHQFHSLHRQLC